MKAMLMNLRRHSSIPELPRAPVVLPMPEFTYNWSSHHVTIARLLLGGLLVFGTACTSTPSKPTPPNPGPDPGPVVQNTPPTIGAFRAQGSRTGQPAGFADLGEAIALSVTVTNPESAASGLTFNWASTLGTFSGTGPSVTWRAPASATTPMDVTLALEVVETYQSQGRNVENRVTGSTTKPPQFHPGSQRPRETIPPRLFESSLSVDYVMRNFEPASTGPKPRPATSPTIVRTSPSSSRTSATPTPASDSAGRAGTGTAPETRARACRSIGSRGPSATCTTREESASCGKGKSPSRPE